MSGIPAYIFRQIGGPLLFFTFVLTGVVWLSQSLRMLDLVINQSQSAATYIYLTLLALPSLMALILPFALFCAVLYALNRLYTESELVVIWAAGSSCRNASAATSSPASTHRDLAVMTPRAF